MADTKSKKILIVDDEPDVVTYLSTLFEDNNYDIITAVNGKQAVAKAKSDKPDLITLDITMPEESGVRAFRDLQNDPETKSIPIIIVTGVTSDFKKFIESRKQVEPPTAYFEKPIDRERLLETVKKLLGE